MRVLIALAFATSACLEARLVPCGDLLCPVGATCTETGCMCAGGPCPTRCGNSIVETGEACDDGNQFGTDGCNGTCTSDESCGNGIVELAEQCDCGDVDRPGPATCGDTINGGAICSDTCSLRRCGDGAKDPGEACDDGNNVAGDGCNFDCTSSEVCGNGVLDYFAGELCDDGNTRNRDGCGGTCRLETLAWEAFVGVPAPRLANMAMAYDAGRGRVVAFGGDVDSDNVGRAITLELDGTTWRTVATPITPPGRFAAHMVYDAARKRLVMFGGEGDGGCLNDTWEFDGATWTEIVPVPATACSQSMAYDGVAKRLVVRMRDSLYELGSSWVVADSVPAPNADLVHDPGRGVLIAVSGATLYERAAGGAWTLHGATVPSVDSRRFVYDGARRRVLLVGRTNGAPALWEFDGTSWIERTRTSAPTMGIGQGVAYDVSRRRLVVYGGTHAPGSVNDTWQLVDDVWSLVVASNPGYVSGPSLAFDSVRGCSVLVSQSSTTTTWELCGDRWTARAITTPRGSIVYDSARRRVVLYESSTGDTWEYDGVSWMRRMPLASPPRRTDPRLAYDVARARTVMFGGRIDADFVNETWTYNGTTWTQEAPASSPPNSPWELTYDVKRDRVVAFGGREFGGDRTWEYDGTTWTRIFPTISPPRRMTPGMTYDPLHERVVLFGGQGDASSLADTWIYDGVTWTRFQGVVAPPRSSQPALTYDTARGHIVLHGDATDVATWRFSAVPSAPIEACTTGIDYDRDGDTGCADDDCWGRCAPLCTPASFATCTTVSPRCGDGSCDVLENCHTCPTDCDLESKGCVLACGDATCNASESIATCPGDCTP
ncbi:MAG: hypothetical protein ACKV2T_35435 [Kofleriaceae bacterium]